MEQRNVLVMISPMSGPRLAGVARYAKEHGWHLMVQDRLGYQSPVWRGNGALVTLRADATMADCVKRLRRAGTPVVDLTINRPDIRLPRVTSDHAALAVGLAANRLFACVLTHEGGETGFDAGQQAMGIRARPPDEVAAVSRLLVVAILVEIAFVSSGAIGVRERTVRRDGHYRIRVGVCAEERGHPLPYERDWIHHP